MSTKADLIRRLSGDKETRSAFVAARIKKDIPLQIRALRKKKGWSQKDLADHTGMKQARISTLENLDYGKFNTETLKRIASAFDVALLVRFAPFSELLHWVDKLSQRSFEVPSFEEELTEIKVATRAEATAKSTWASFQIAARKDATDSASHFVSVTGSDISPHIQRLVTPEEKYTIATPVREVSYGN